MHRDTDIDLGVLYRANGDCEPVIFVISYPIICPVKRVSPVGSDPERRKFVAGC